MEARDHLAKVSYDDYLALEAEMDDHDAAHVEYLQQKRLDEAVKAAVKAAVEQTTAQQALQSARDSVLDVFAARGLVPTERERARVLACTDIQVLRAWLRAAVTAPSVADVFRD